MIPCGVSIYACTSPVDMRWSFERLAGVVRERVGYEPRGGALFIFFGKRRETVKVMFFDGTGMCLFYKRLDRGVFAHLESLTPDAAYLEMDEAAFQALLDGVVPETPEKPKRPRRRIH